MANRWGNNGNIEKLYFSGLQNHCRWYCSHEIKRFFLLGRRPMTNLDSLLKSRDITLPTKVHLVKAMVFPVLMYGWMWELGYKESYAPKNWCFWTLVLENTLESPLDCKEIQPVRWIQYYWQWYWSGLPIPPPGNLPNPGMEHRSPLLQEDSLPSESLGNHKYKLILRQLIIVNGIYIYYNKP